MQKDSETKTWKKGLHWGNSIKAVKFEWGSEGKDKDFYRRLQECIHFCERYSEKAIVYSRGLEMCMGRRGTRDHRWNVDVVHNLGKKSKVRLCGTLNFMTVAVEPFL